MQRGKRLRFKRKRVASQAEEKFFGAKPSSTAKTGILRENVSETEKLRSQKPQEVSRSAFQTRTSEHSAFEELDQSQKHVRNDRRQKRPRSRDISKVYEYGPMVDGYRYVSFNESDALGGYYSHEFSEAESSDDALGGNDSDLNVEETHFQAYLRKWQDITGEKHCGGVPLPVASGLLEDVNLGNVREFLVTKANAKAERVRWHPDKMRLVLGDSELITSEDITHVFQTVNAVYERWDN